MKVALVHDWLNGMRGGERVLEAMVDLFPDAHIYTLFCDPEKISEKLNSCRIVTSFIQSLPGRKTQYRHYLPLFPKAIEKFDFSKYDLMISTSHCVAKGAIPGKNTIHICYSFSPMRYVWDRFDDYFPRDRINPLRYGLIKMVTKRLREWDRRSSSRVHLFIADSNFVKARIDRYYNRPSEVIFPPVDTDFHTPGAGKKGDYYLLAGAMVPYKKGDIVVEAFRDLDLNLVVTGDGPELSRLKGMASDNIEFAGWIDNETLREYYRGCKALIFPGVEDFGIVPVEAQACGKPVIAFGEGGALDTVIGPTIENYKEHQGFKSGLFFPEQTPDSIRTALGIFDRMTFDSQVIVQHAKKFSGKLFSQAAYSIISRAYDHFEKKGISGLEDKLIS
jgi:glycosyltransferase involved in cell wall biosynthesis